MNEYRQLPAVDQLLSDLVIQAAIQQYGYGLTREACRDVLAARRAAITAQGGPRDTSITGEVLELLLSWTRTSPRAVINATGVILHTNLGRAPLSAAAVAAAGAAAGYCDLELDLETGSRGRRGGTCEHQVCLLTGAEDALIVNNNAASVLLILTALARRRRVIISRSQLVEIGGGFRIPEVMNLSGARLVEIGTTNKTHLKDYQEALSEPAALVLRVHPSNFRIEGFTAQVPLADIVTMAHQAGALVVDDLGSGLLSARGAGGMEDEPRPRESIDAGADLICFSGDKLVGGPQAGIIAGKKDLVEKLRRHPLARALRIDKINLAALSATFSAHLRSAADVELPVWRMISAKTDELESRVVAWQKALGFGIIKPSQATIGGGSLPGETLSSWCLEVSQPNLSGFARRLRNGRQSVVGRLEKGRLVLDARSVLPEQDEELIQAVREAVAT